MKIFENLSQICCKRILSDTSVIIGLDVGDKTIGIAVSDRSILIASFVCTLNRKYLEYDCKELLKIFSQYDVALVVFGWPLHMNGDVSEQCGKILMFIEAFAQYIDVEFVKWDERLSTKVADRLMISANMSRKKRKTVIDSVAAAYILQGAIDRLRQIIAQQL